ncbi:MAG TPA: D-2-hydroxyacid dehydrogenase [bacterium]|nr:D-2-hydroxyacid dehydrogenase [bacterium]
MPPEAGRVVVAALAQRPGRTEADAAPAESHAAAIEAVDPRVRLVRVSNRAHWLEEAPDAEVIVGFRPLREAATRARLLRWVHSMGAGVENLCRDVAGTDIIVTNSHVHGDVIAEHVMALALAHARRLPAAIARQAEGRWTRDGAVGTVLRGHAMGVVGLGAIGTELARRTAAFGMRVWGVRRSGAAVPGVERVVAPDRLDEVLRVADYLALTLPLTQDTRGLIGARELALLPRGAFVVNVGRGGIVDEAALADAVESGRLGGAGLDVFEEEPLPPSSPLWRLPGVIITPHVGGSFPGFLDRAVPFFCENLKRYLAGEPLLNRVDVTRGY